MTVQNHNFSTRANIINCIGDHEFKGHYKSGFHHEKGKKDPTYRMQKNSPNWKKTTTSFKKYINDVIKANGYEESFFIVSNLFVLMWMHQ